MNCDGKKQSSLDSKTSTKKTLRISSRDTVQATDLFDYYLQNMDRDQEQVVQKTLKGKKFHIKGRIRVADKEWKDRLEYVQLKAFEKDKNTLLVCHLSNKVDRERLLGLDENTSVTLFGEFVGFGTFPNLKDCRLISQNSSLWIGRFLY